MSSPRRCPSVRRDPHDHPIVAHQVVARRPAGHRSPQRECRAATHRPRPAARADHVDDPAAAHQRDELRDRAELDAARLVDLFASPWDHVAESVPPVEFAPRPVGATARGSTDSPADWRKSWRPRRCRVRPTFRCCRGTRCDPGARCIRIASLLIEWCRYGGEDARVVDAVGAKKLRLYELRDAAVRTAAVLNVDTLERIPDLPVDDAEAARSIVQRRVPEVTGQLDAVVEQWREITSIAAELAALMPRAASPPPARTAAGHELRRVLERLLPPTVSPEHVQRALDQIDLALLPLHRGEARRAASSASGTSRSRATPALRWPSPSPGPPRSPNPNPVLRRCARCRTARARPAVSSSTTPAATRARSWRATSSTTSPRSSSGVGGPTTGCGARWTRRRRSSTWCSIRRGCHRCRPPGVTTWPPRSTASAPVRCGSTGRCTRGAPRSSPPRRVSGPTT